MFENQLSREKMYVYVCVCLVNFTNKENVQHTYNDKTYNMLLSLHTAHWSSQNALADVYQTLISGQLMIATGKHA